MITLELASAVSEAIQKAYDHTVEPDTIAITIADSQHGDYSSNIGFILAKQLKQAPQVIAERLASELAHAHIEKTQAMAGYLNMTLDDSYWLGQLKAISSDYAKNDQGAGRQVQVEFISANPTGPTTVGNARGGFIGDVLSNVLVASGYQVTREYYFNNAGTQISKLLESVRMEAGIIPETDERQYRGDYIKEVAAKFAEELTTESDDQLKELITTYILHNYIEPAVKAMGIEFDVWFNEQDLVADGSLAAVIEKLRAKRLVTEHDGALWLQTGELGDERPERVLVKSNGDPTYLAPDLAYHDVIFGKRGFDYAIKLLGPDHIAQFPSVQAAVGALHPDKRLRMAGYQWLRLMKDGKEVKVSKRLGQFVTVLDLIEQVGLPVARFLILMRSADSHMDFDLDLAREQSNKNPYYYVMYSYARVTSLLAKAESEGLTPASAPNAIDTHDRELIKLIDRLPALIWSIAESFEVHSLAFMALEWSKNFHDWYESTRVLSLPPEEAANKLAVARAYQIAIQELFKLLGIEALDTM